MNKIHIQNINLNLGSNAMSGALMAALSASMATPKPEAPTFSRPAIGEYWDGQGGIFAGRARGRDGGREYNLIIPTHANASLKSVSLGTYGTDVTGATSGHDGLANTTALAAAGSELCKQAMALEVDGFKDFYLPSRMELRLCWSNVPELFEKEWYLSSTQYSSRNAWSQHFNNGTQGINLKTLEARALFCRRSSRGTAQPVNGQ